jgi:hypothetical protein
MVTSFEDPLFIPLITRLSPPPDEIHPRFGFLHFLLLHHHSHHSGKNRDYN